MKKKVYELGVWKQQVYFTREVEICHEIADKLRLVFSEWIDNGHNDFEDKNTIILCIKLEDGVLFSHGTAYNIDFSEDAVTGI